MESHPQPIDHPFKPQSPAAKRVAVIIRRLRAAYPDAQTALKYSTPWELLVATILSAQSTDAQVNQVTPALFKKYPTAAAVAEADRPQLEKLIRSTGFYHQKARYIQEASRIIAHDYDGEVPADMNALLELPGVARKTANVVLGAAFEIADGIVMDTHVQRLARRLQLTKETNPGKMERDLMALVPREEWIEFGHWLIFHGRRVCHARKPDCANCVVNDLCPSRLTDNPDLATQLHAIGFST